MFFIFVLVLTAVSIAATAAFFSIYGLAAIFSGIFIPVIIMGSVLEVGKLVAVSYLYRYYTKISFIMKTYLFTSILILMLITSVGIFGYLSMGYQQDTLPLKQQEQRIVLLHEEQIELKQFKEELMVRKKQIDDDIASLPNNYIKGRQRLMKAYGDELKELKSNISEYTTNITANTLLLSDIKQQKLLTEVHTGPIIFLAESLGQDINDATKWMILLIIFVFDPLAICLTIAANHAIMQRKQLNKTNISDSSPPTEHDKPESSITNISSNISVDALKQALDELQNKELTIVELAQRGMLEEMLARKLVTEKIRNPEKKIDI